jgi:protocatechuate 3,4-dioxygenase beta subunit
MTPYFEEFLKLRRKNKKNSVYLSEEAFKYRLETKTDEFGRFQFTKMKPGKYYIECMINFAATGANVVQTGTSTLYNTNNGQTLSSSPIYDKFFYNYDFANRESQIVEIKQDGQILNIKL